MEQQINNEDYSGIHVDTFVASIKRYPALQHRWKFSMTTDDKDLDTQVLNDQIIGVQLPDIDVTAQRFGIRHSLSLSTVFESDNEFLTMGTLLNMSNKLVSITIVTVGSLEEPRGRYECKGRLTNVSHDNLTYTDGKACRIHAEFDLVEFTISRNVSSDILSSGDWHQVHKYSKSA